MQQPLVSVILPFYNAESTLLRAMESIGRQSYSNFECILVNNNSSDKGPMLANDFCLRDSRFRMLNESRQGVVYASNAGCASAKGEFMARMDADDAAFADRLKLQAEYLVQHPETDAVGGLVEYKAHREGTDGFARYVDWVNSLVDYPQIMANRFAESPIVNPTAMWRASSALKYGMYRNGDFPEDYEMWLRWLHEGAIINKVNKSVLYWHDSDQRLTRTNEIYSDRAFYKIKTRYLALQLKRSQQAKENIWIWGASKISRKFVTMLEEEQISIQGYIDTKTSRQLDKPVLHYSNIDLSQQKIILVYMKHLDLKKEIRNYLQEKNYTEGENFFFLS